MRNPLAVFKPLSEHQTQARMKAHDIVCAHTMVNSLTGCDRDFRKGGFAGVEAHYGVGGVWGEDVDGGPGGSSLDGVVWQWQERAFEAEANFRGNRRVISIETADNAPEHASGIEPWSDAQLGSIAAVMAWECSLEAHTDCPEDWDCHRGVEWRGIRVAIPPELVPDSKRSRRGLALHRQGVLHSQGFGVPGFLVEGGERWSRAPGKECPGDERVRQFVEIVVPAVQARMLGLFTAVEEDEDMVAAETVHLGTSSSIVLGQPDGAITLEEAIALRTAAALRRNELLRRLAATQRDFANGLRALHPPG
jgi:hypothetical protein